MEVVKTNRAVNTMRRLNTARKNCMKVPQNCQACQAYQREGVSMLCEDHRELEEYEAYMDQLDQDRETDREIHEEQYLNSLAEG